MQQAPREKEKERVKEKEGLPAPAAVERHHTIQAPPQGSAIVRRFGSIASRRRTSSLVGAPPPTVPSPPREARNSLAEGEVLSDSETGSGVGRWGTIGRRWKGARVNGRTASGPSPLADEKRPMSAGMAGIVDEEEEEHERTVEEERSEAHTTVSPTATKEQQAQHKAMHPDNFKAMPLKGTFSVATTSTKGAKALRADVRSTLTRMGVTFREIPGGFECSHEPSIVASSQKTRPLRKKTSKLSVVPRRRQTAPEEPTTPRKTKEKALPDRPTTPSHNQNNGDDSVSSSLVHLAAAVRDAYDQQPDTPRGIKSPMVAPPSPVLVKVAPPTTPIRRDFAKTDQADVNGGVDAFKTSPLGVRFEIHIVKVPILPLHGVQFHRLSGDGHQYYMLARRVITELKL